MNPYVQEVLGALETGGSLLDCPEFALIQARPYAASESLARIDDELERRYLVWLKCYLR